MSKAQYQLWQSNVAKIHITLHYFTPKLRSLPPRSDEFAEKVKRAHLQTYIWKTALENHPHLDVATFG